MTKNFAVNRKAEFNYFIEDRMEAGIVLEGWEVKAILRGRLSLDNAFVRVVQGEVFLHNAHIAIGHEVSTHVVAEADRPRKLLLNRTEINRLIGKVEEKGYTLVPLKVYQGRKIKVEIGLAKGKKLHDKRDSLKERDAERERAQALKQQVR